MMNWFQEYTDKFKFQLHLQTSVLFEITLVQAGQLVFVDECGSIIAHAPIYARNLKDQRDKGSIRHNCGKNT
jgi:hypothetical protein